MSAWNGHDPAGQWYFFVEDKVVNGQAGLLGPLTAEFRVDTCKPELSVYQEITQSFPNLSAPLTYTVHVLNEGYTATQVLLTDTLPLETKFMGLDSGDWACSTPAAGTSGGTIHCSRPSLVPEIDRPLIVTVLTPPEPAMFTSTLQVSAAEPELSLTRNTYGREKYAWAHGDNGQPWDVMAAKTLGLSHDDSGEMDDGGQDAFDGWGTLRARVMNGSSVMLAEADILGGFGLQYQPGHRWETTSSVTLGGVKIARRLYAPPAQNWLRYVDSFTNNTDFDRQVLVAWGGNLGSDSNTRVDSSSSADTLITAADTWAVTTQQPNPGDPAGDPPVGYTLRSPADITFQGPIVFDAPAITTTWTVSDGDKLGYLFRLNLAPRQTARLAYFVYRNLAEGDAGPEDCGLVVPCVVPATGSEVLLARAAMQALAAAPAFCDLSAGEMATLANWPGVDRSCRLLLPVTLKQ
jgi:uncharacterized repeat protein (TIGR01451 family)